MHNNFAGQTNAELTTLKPELPMTQDSSQDPTANQNSFSSEELSLITVATCLVVAIFCGLIFGVFLKCNSKIKQKLARSNATAKTKDSTELSTMPVSVPEETPSTEHNEEADHEYEEIPTLILRHNAATEAADSKNISMTSETIALEENVAYMQKHHGVMRDVELEYYY